MADGAGVHFDAIWAMTVKSELGALEKENPGCSTLVLEREGAHWLCHNEDGHSAYLDLMFLVRVSPPSGVGFVSMVYPGTLTGNGPSLNSRGVVQTTNYIGALRSEIGVPRYVIGRAILEAESLGEAEQIAGFSPRAYPYHHNLASVGGGYRSVETVPGQAAAVSPGGPAGDPSRTGSRDGVSDRALYVHTNHLLLDGTRGWPHEDDAYRNSSSRSRYRTLCRLARDVDAGTVTVRDLLSLLESHRGAPYSPCRHPAGEVHGQTLGTAVFDLRSGSFRLYRGNPCLSLAEERFVELGQSTEGVAISVRRCQVAT